MFFREGEEDTPGRLSREVEEPEEGEEIFEALGPAVSKKFGHGRSSSEVGEVIQGGGRVEALGLAVAEEEAT
jgi:hypothetical protein